MVKQKLTQRVAAVYGMVVNMCTGVWNKSRKSVAGRMTNPFSLFAWKDVV